MDWSKDIKRIVWQKIIKQKILTQSYVLKMKNKFEKSNQLLTYYDKVELGDITNREGHAAKVYFNELFGMDFIRKRNADDIVNSSLNYVYQILRSKISQEIIAHGYIPSIGIFHCSEYNYFGLADDLIEVYRPIVDFYVINILENEDINFMTTSYKEKLLNILYENIFYGSNKQKIIESIRLFVINVVDAITNKKTDSIIFPVLAYE